MHIKRRNKIQRIFLRIKVAYRIIFKYKHGVVISISRDQLVELLTDNIISTQVKGSYFGMMDHQMKQVIKIVGNEIDETELICEKALFEVTAEELINPINPHE